MTGDESDLWEAWDHFTYMYVIHEFSLPIIFHLVKLFCAIGVCLGSKYSQMAVEIHQISGEHYTTFTRMWITVWQASIFPFHSVQPSCQVVSGWGYWWESEYWHGCDRIKDCFSVLPSQHLYRIVSACLAFMCTAHTIIVIHANSSQNQNMVVAVPNGRPKEAGEREPVCD